MLEKRNGRLLYTRAVILSKSSTESILNRSVIITSLENSNSILLWHGSLRACFPLLLNLSGMEEGWYNCCRLHGSLLVDLIKNPQAAENLSNHRKKTPKFKIFFRLRFWNQTGGYAALLQIDDPPVSITLLQLNWTWTWIGIITGGEVEI